MEIEFNKVQILSYLLIVFCYLRNFKLIPVNCKIFVRYLLVLMNELSSDENNERLCSLELRSLYGLFKLKYTLYIIPQNLGLHAVTFINNNLQVVAKC